MTSCAEPSRTAPTRTVRCGPRPPAPERGAARAAAARRGREGPELPSATRLAYETVQRRRTLDAVIAELAGRDVERLDAPVLAALRLGVLQLAFLGRVGRHS